ncbi:MAG TPA: hypothetical protein DG048_18895 [Pseudoalteromonas sp.]|nr:hypothetical protein [Pseudoalteromonas sp.]|tara:strand:+ start:553 stop:939 length:387 start_codon:yes stop_codon:yes gene_type:complete
MNTTDTGKLGELRSRFECLRQGIKVYIPESDTSGVDFIAETKAGKFLKVQVKTMSAANRSTSLEIKLVKYVDSNRVDVMAIYLLSADRVAFVPYENQKSLNLALTTAKNNQEDKRKWFYQFERFPEFS